MTNKQEVAKINLRDKMAHFEERKKLERYDFYLALLHWMGLALILLFALFPELEEYKLNKTVIYPYIAAGALFTLIYHHLLPKKFINPKKFILEGYIDILALTFLMVFSGFHSSLFFFYYFFVIAGSALIFGRKRTFYDVTLITLLFLSVFGLEYQYGSKYGYSELAEGLFPHLVHLMIILSSLWIVAFWSGALAAIIEKSLADEKDLTLKNKELYEKELKARRELTAIQETSATVLSNHNLDQVLKRIVAGLTQKVGYDMAAIFLINKQEKTIEGKYASGISEELTRKIKIPLLKGEGALFDTIWQAKPFVVKSLFEDLEFQKKLKELKLDFSPKLATVPIVSRLEQGKCKEMIGCNNPECPLFESSEAQKVLRAPVPKEVSLTEEKIEKTLSCPMFKVFGAVVVDNFKSKRPITKENMAGLQVFAQNAAIAIENATLYGFQKERFKAETQPYKVV